MNKPMAPPPAATSLIHASAFVEEGALIGAGASIWHFAHVRKGAQIGDRVSLGKGVYVDPGVRIGCGSRIQNGVSVYEGVQIGRWCFIGPGVVFTNDLSPRAGIRDWKVVETIIEDGASIGAGAVIRCGVRVGAFALVAAGAVVTHDIPPFRVARGVPARPDRMVCACAELALPIGSEKSKLIAPCCARRCLPELLELAEGVLRTLDS